MNEMSMDRVYQAINGALANQDYRTMSAMLWPALDQFPNDHNLLHFATHLLTKEGKLTLALLCAEKANEIEPNQANYTNLGGLYRRLNAPEAALAALHEAIGYDPDNKHPWNNLAAAYVNEGNPHPGIDAANEALRIDPDFHKARWNKGLLELELGSYSEGWDDYRIGLVIGERLMKTYSEGEDEPAFCDSREQLVKWRHDHGRKPRIVVWGEQGIGDEIMFSTCLLSLKMDAEIVYDCHPRLHKLMETSYGQILSDIYPTRKVDGAPWYKDIEPCQFKCSIGDLPRWYRRNADSFHEAWAMAPWLYPDHEKVDMYRQCLEDLAPGKKLVGFAWTGGIINTQRWYRTVQLPQLKNILLNEQIQPVSLQYEDDTATVQNFLEQTGKLMFRFPAVTQHFDYNHTLDLVMSLDAVVTVCQSVAHLAAAAGKKTFVLVPKAPAWRYGLKGSTWDWYGDATLYRADESGWGGAIERLEKDLMEYLNV